MKKILIYAALLSCTISGCKKIEKISPRNETTRLRKAAEKISTVSTYCGICGTTRILRTCQIKNMTLCPRDHKFYKDVKNRVLNDVELESIFKLRFDKHPYWMSSEELEEARNKPHPRTLYEDFKKKNPVRGRKKPSEV